MPPPSAAPPLGVATRVARALRARLEDGEHAAVRLPGELGDRVGAHLVRLTPREQVAFLIYEGFPGTQIHRAVPLVDTPRALLVLEALHGDGVERVPLDVLPVALLQHREPVEAGTLEPADELLL